MVLSGFVTAWRLAGWPIRRSPSLVKATTLGVVRAPSEFSMTLGLPPSITATQLLVVPRSIPITFAIVFSTLSCRPRAPVRHARVSWFRRRYREGRSGDKGPGLRGGNTARGPLLRSPDERRSVVRVSAAIGGGSKRRQGVGVAEMQYGTSAVAPLVRSSPCRHSR